MHVLKIKFCLKHYILLIILLITTLVFATEEDLEWSSYELANFAASYNGYDYEWGGGHDYDFYFDNSDDIDNFGVDCSGLINAVMWDAGYAIPHSGYTVSQWRNDNSFFETYNNQSFSMRPGDIIISANGQHMGIIDAVNGNGTIDIRHASQGRDEVLVDSGINPSTSSFWGQNNGAVYRSLISGSDD